MNENEKFDEGLEKAKEVSGNFLKKVWSFIKTLKNRVTDLEDSGGKIIAIAQFLLNLTYYLCVICFVLWIFVGLFASRTYNWSYYGGGYYTFNIGIYLGGFLAIVVIYLLQYWTSLFLKSYGELVNNTKVMADDCKLKQIEQANPEEINQEIDALLEETL